MCDVISCSSVLRRRVVSAAFQLNENYLSRSFIDTCINNLIDAEYYVRSPKFHDNLIDDRQCNSGHEIRMEQNNCYLVINDRPFIVHIYKIFFNQKLKNRYKYN